MSEFQQNKRDLTAALKEVAADPTTCVSITALVGTEDPAVPFEYRWVLKAGATSRENSLINQRLFDAAFLDFGFREIRDENNLEGVVYKSLEEKLADSECIGVAPVEFFSGSERIRMAHGIEDEDAEDSPDAFKFAGFLKSVETQIIDGEPSQQLDYEDVTNVVGLIFKYEAAGANPVVAFQRTQRMWIQQKSNMLTFSREGEMEFFSDRSLKFGNSFDFVIHKGFVMFRTLKSLEGLFSFRTLVQSYAQEYAEVLEHLVEDSAKLEERINESPTVVNKILKLQKDASPVVDMPAEEVCQRVRGLSYYNSKVHFNEDGKVLLVTNANVNNFLKMLGDDLVMSPLTGVRYQSRSKKRLDDIDGVGE